MFSERGKPLKLPVIRGGNETKGFSLLIKNRKFARLLRALLYARTKKKQLQLLRLFLFVSNSLLTLSSSLRFSAGGSLDYTQILLIALPSSISGFLITLLNTNPLIGIVLPLLILSGRGIEDIPDPYEKCRAMCKVAKKFHNEKLALEMKELTSLVEDTSAELKLPLDKVPLLCVEQKLSLLERYKLREVIKTSTSRKRVQHFSEFIKQFPECQPDIEAVYKDIVPEKIKLVINK